jgi:hypothetical protein
LQPRYIIIHGTAGGTSAEAIASYFKSTEGSNNPVSSHYIVGQDGRVVQAVSEQDGAWANGDISGTPANLPFHTVGDGVHRDAWWNPSVNPNNITISIEHCKPSSDNSNALTPTQQEASFHLILDICQRHNIPSRPADASGGITGHFSIDPINRSHCPGPYPWDKLWNYLEGATIMITLDTPRVSQYFDGSPNVWRCKKNGYFVGHAILSFYQKFGGDALCGVTYLGLPLSNETAVSGHPGVVYQRFERGVLAYDPQHTIDSPPASGNVYCMHIDSGLGQDPRIAQLQAQIAQLQQPISALTLQTLPTSPSPSAPASQTLPTTQSSPTSTNQSQQT